MMLRALFDEKRRAEIRHAISTGTPIEFRRKMPKLDEPAQGGLHSRITTTLSKLYGKQRYALAGVFFGGKSVGFSDNDLRTMRIQARMAKAIAKPEGGEASGPNGTKGGEGTG